MTTNAILNLKGFGTEYVDRGALRRVVNRDGAPGKAHHELRFVPVYDLGCLADGGVTASLSKSSMGGCAWPGQDGAQFKVFKPWVTGTFRHELGHCVFWSLTGNESVAVHRAFKAALAKIKGYAPSSAFPTVSAAEDALFAETGLPSKRAADNVDEFFAESYRRYQIHALRSAKGSTKPGLPDFRAASPLMADFFDRHYSKALEVAC